MNAPPSKVLIVLLGAIGDVLRGLPLAMRLRSGWPETRIAWAVEPAAAPMVQAHPAIDDIVVFRRGQGAAAFGRFLSEVRALRADVALDLQRHAKSGVTTLASGAPRRIGFAWRNSREGNWFFSNEHVAPVERFSAKIQHYLLFADYLGVPARAIEFGLKSTEEERRKIDELLAGVRRPFVVVFIGASGPARRWIASEIAATVRALQERGRGAVLAGGPDDRAFADEILAQGCGSAVDLTGRTKLRELVALCEKASCVLSGDSGPMHVAAAVGTPVIGLFGATDPARSAPYGFEAQVIRGPAPCAPCYRKKCPVGQICMHAISSSSVLDRFDELTARHRFATGSNRSVTTEREGGDVGVDRNRG